MIPVSFMGDSSSSSGSFLCMFMTLYGRCRSSVLTKPLRVMWLLIYSGIEKRGRVSSVTAEPIYGLLCRCEGEGLFTRSYFSVGYACSACSYRLLPRDSLLVVLVLMGLTSEFLATRDLQAVIGRCSNKLSLKLE